MKCLLLSGFHVYLLRLKGVHATPGISGAVARGFFVCTHTTFVRIDLVLLTWCRLVRIDFLLLTWCRQEKALVEGRRAAAGVCKHLGVREGYYPNIVTVEEDEPHIALGRSVFKEVRSALPRSGVAFGEFLV